MLGETKSGGHPPESDLSEAGARAWKKCGDLAARVSTLAGWPGVAAQTVFSAGVASTGADEGTIWVADAGDAELIPVYNSGPNAELLVGCYRHRLDHGLISLAYRAEQTLCEEEVFRNAEHVPTVDSKVGRTTASMLVVPLYYGGRVRGVLSAVKLIDSPDSPTPPPFDRAAITSLAQTGEGLRMIIEHEILTRVLEL